MQLVVRTVISHFGWFDSPIVPARELYALYHPMGRNIADRLEEATAEHPEETDHWLETMADWHRLLLSSFPLPADSETASRLGKE